MKPCSLIRGLILHKNQLAVAFQSLFHKEWIVSFDKVRKTRLGGAILCNHTTNALYTKDKTLTW